LQITVFIHGKIEFFLSYSSAFPVTFHNVEKKRDFKVSHGAFYWQERRKKKHCNKSRDDDDVAQVNNFSY
jgi:hypothetical protein